MAGAKSAVYASKLKPIHVPPALVNGDRFMKWDDVSTMYIDQHYSTNRQLFEFACTLKPTDDQTQKIGQNDLHELRSQNGIRSFSI